MERRVGWKRGEQVATHYVRAAVITRSKNANLINGSLGQEGTGESIKGREDPGRVNDENVLHGLGVSGTHDFE